VFAAQKNTIPIDKYFVEESLKLLKYRKYIMCVTDTPGVAGIESI